MVSSRFKKMNGPIIPNLELAKQERSQASTSGHAEPSRNYINGKESTLSRQHRGNNLATGNLIPMSTPRGASSYKDILLTPRTIPIQQAKLRGFQTSRPSFDAPVLRQGNTSMNRSPQTARAPRRSQQEKSGLDQVQRNNNSASSTLYNLAKQVEELERSKNNDNVEIARSILKSIQMAGSMIGVPAGILEMLQMHEQQRILRRIQEPRKVPIPVTPDHSSYFTRIRSKLSDVEHALQTEI